MTMLDRMRRHKNWLKWSLAIVVVAFVLLYIPNFLRGGGMAGAGAARAAATSSRRWTVGRLRSPSSAGSTTSRCRPTAAAYGGSIDERLLKQMGIDRRILQQLIDEEAGLAEARRLGITTSDEEVRTRILALPAFQENGQFIGDAALSAAAPDGGSPAAPVRVRGGSAPQHDPQQAAGRADRLDDRISRRRHRGIQEAQREGEARRRFVPLRQVPRGDHRHRRRDCAAVRTAQERLPHSRQAQGALRAARHAEHPQPHAGHPAGRAALLRGQRAAGTRRPSRCAPATSCSRPRARTTPR